MYPRFPYPTFVGFDVSPDWSRCFLDDMAKWAMWLR